MAETPLPTEQGTITVYGLNDYAQNVPKTPPDYIVAAFIKTHTDEEEKELEKNGGRESFFKMEDCEGPRGCLGAMEMCMMRQVTSRYQHCQLIFSWKPKNNDDPQIRVTFSTTKTDPSQYVMARYNDRRWCGVDIQELPDLQHHRKLFNWCRCNQNTPFNPCGLYWNFLPCVPKCCAYDAEGEKFFCAEQVAYALRFCGAPSFANIDYWLCTPDNIYDILTKCKRNKPTPLVMRFIRCSSEISRFQLSAAQNNIRPRINNSVCTRMLASSSSNKKKDEDHDEDNTDTDIISNSFGRRKNLDHEDRIEVSSNEKDDEEKKLVSAKKDTKKKKKKLVEVIAV